METVGKPSSETLNGPGRLVLNEKKKRPQAQQGRCCGATNEKPESSQRQEKMEKERTNHKSAVRRYRRRGCNSDMGRWPERKVRIAASRRCPTERRG